MKNALSFGIVMLLGACGGKDVTDSAMAITARKSHGVSLGSALMDVTLTCTDGLQRATAPRGITQLITFTSTYDCLDCFRHLEGLDSLALDKRLPGREFVVAYGPAGLSEDNEAMLRARTRRPLCMDTAGALWRQHGLSSTPFTVLVRDGRVVFLHDLPTDNARARERFVTQLARIER